MKRRAFLATVVGTAGALAGCQEVGSDGPSRGTYVVPDREETTPTAAAGEATVPSGVTPVSGVAPPDDLVRSVVAETGPDRRYVVVGTPFSELPDDVAVTVGFLETVTDRAPARLWIAFSRRDDGDDDGKRVYEFGPTPPFSGFRGRVRGDDTDDAGSLYLVPRNDRLYADDFVVPDAPDGGCWRVLGDPDENVVHTPPVRVPLRAGESIVGEYGLLSGSECSPGRRAYVFRGDPVGTTFGVATWTPDEAAPSRSRFDRRVPPLPDANEVAWFHEATNETGLYLEPETESLSLPTGTVSFHLENFTARTVPFSNRGWRLYKLHEGTWKIVGPWRRVGSFGFLVPGGRTTVEVAVDDRPGRDEDPIGDANFVGLGPGLYAFRFGRGPVDPEPPGPLQFGPGSDVDVRLGDAVGEEVARAALVELAGPAVSLTPPPSLAYQRRDDDAVTVRLEGDARGDQDPFVVRRADLSVTETELITEQVYQSSLLRAALASLSEFPSVDVARVVAPGHRPERPIHRFGSAPGRGLSFEYEGETFVATARPRSGDGG